jgi:hypothetical protein
MAAMADETSNRDSLRWQADFCRRGGAPIVGRVCDALAEVLDRSSRTGRRLLDWPGDPRLDALPLRVAAPFHALARAGSVPALARVYSGALTDPAEVAAVVRTTIADQDEEIAGWLVGPPQTNAPARSGVLMAGLLVLAKRYGPRFELLEIGSSAGLNLLIDRYGFDLGGVRVGPSDAPVRVAPEWRGSPPPDAEIRIESVRGVDIAPIDVSGDAQAERLMAYVWADDKVRMARLATAIGMARVAPPRLEQGDAADWIEARLAEPQAQGETRVLMHSVVWQYLPPAGQARIEAAMAAAVARATRERPLGWITYEADRTANMHVLKVRSWPGDGTRQLLATAHPHGAWSEWRGADRDQPSSSSG